jgi:hypothetical protein
MENVLGYYVFDPARGWLQDDEKTWAFDFHGGAEFSTASLANDIGKRETPGDTATFYVLACLGSME